MLYKCVVFAGWAMQINIMCTDGDYGIMTGVNRPNKSHQKNHVQAKYQGEHKEIGKLISGYHRP